MYEISAAMNAAVQKVLARTAYTEFVIELKLICSSDPGWSFKPFFLERVTIAQDPIHSYADRISVKFECSPAEYMQLFQRQQELRAVLIIKYVDAQTEQYVFDPEPDLRKYIAFIKNPQDLYKTYATGQFQPTERSVPTEQHQAQRVPVELDLIEEPVYNLRHVKFTGLFGDASINSLLLYISKMVQELPRSVSNGITAVHLVPADNTHTYNNLQLSSQDFASVFLYLQETYGVYMKGIEYYISNGVLYIYPPYENKPIIKDTIKIYNVAANRYVGLKSYHKRLDANTIEIVAAGKTETRDIAGEGAENIGTGITFTRASQLIDNYVTMTADGPVMGRNNTVSLVNKVNRAMRRGANNSIHAQTTDNICLAASKLAMWNATVVSFAWPQAIPMSLIPGSHVLYNYDDNNVFRTKHGILESTIYTILPKTRTGLGTIYNCSAVVQCRIEPDENMG